MKKHYIIFSIILALILILTVSCSPSIPGEETQPFDWSDYTIILPDSGLPAGEGLYGRKYNYLSDIQKAIAAVSGSELQHLSGVCQEQSHEIIIGNAVREQSEKLKQEYHEHDYFVIYEDGDFIIWGGNETSLMSAMDEFIEMIPDISADISEGKLVNHINVFIPVLINGTDILEYKFASTEQAEKSTNNYSDFKCIFDERYGYSLTKYKGDSRYEAYKDKINSKGAKYIIYGKGDGFSTDLPEVASGTAAVVFNGSSIMIYSADDEQGKNLYKYLLKLIDDSPNKDGKIYVELEEGITFVTLE